MRDKAPGSSLFQIILPCGLIFHLVYRCIAVYRLWPSLYFIDPEFMEKFMEDVNSQIQPEVFTETYNSPSFRRNLKVYGPEKSK